MAASSPRAAEPRPAWGAALGTGLGGDLPDLNVWLALVVAEHPHHAAARHYWDEQQAVPALGQRLWFCRFTMLGLVRLLTQPKLMGDGALGLREAHAICQQLRQTEGVEFAGDTETADALLAAWTGEDHAPLPARLWTDACLAASAECAGLRLVSFDTDFSRFALIRRLHLQA
jgi:toxin-antitoxin system PIN domain toxin